MRGWRGAALARLCPLLLLAATDEKQPPAFPAQTELVVVDVAVVGPKGAPVLGLTKQDFIVLEDGVPQTITTFEAVVVAPRSMVASAKEGEPATSGGPAIPPPAPLRTLAVVFDDVNLTLFQGERVKTAIADLLRSHTSAGDEVWLVSPTVGMGRGAMLPEGAEALHAVLKSLRGRRVIDRSATSLSDVEAQDIDVRRDVRTEERVMRRLLAQNESLGLDRDQLRQFVDVRATEVYGEATRRIRVTLVVVERTLERLAGRKGRKSLVLASSGFIYDGGIPEFRAILRASLLANTAIFFLDARGLQGLTPYQDVDTAAALDPADIAETHSAESAAAQGAEVLSADTGGFTLRNTNDLDGGLRLIADTSSAYYLLGYNAPPPPSRGAFRKIQVKLVRGAKGLRIMARRGYFAVPSAGH